MCDPRIFYEKQDYKEKLRHSLKKNTQTHD